MNKKICIMFVFVISLVLLLCGCQEQTETENKIIDENIEFESDIVELVYANLSTKTNNGNVISIDVEYRFKNIAGKPISFNVSAEFYDQDDNLLFVGGPKNIALSKDWEEQGIGPANIISYNDINASKVNHVKIVVSEF